ncbi:MAG: hypothetical protein AAGC77_13305, partial [Pseudomonadota bacterium]
MTIVLDPVLPLWMVFSAAALCVAAITLSLTREWRAGAARLIAITGMLGLLVNPQVRQAEETPLADIALILVDKSASQTLDGRDVVAQAAADALERRLNSIGGMDIRRREFSGAAQTRTVEAVANTLADVPASRVSSVFVITDGQASDAQNAARAALGEAPVHVFITGRQSEADRKITFLNAPRYGIVREPATVSFRIDDLGPDEIPLEARGAAMVTLRVDGEEILRQSVPIGAEARFSAPLNRPGALIIELEVEPRAGELTTRNNIAVLPITAIRDRLRVLLISGEPHPGERVWRNLLKSDPAVDLVHFTILRPINKSDATPVNELALIPFPQNELFIDKLAEFDLLIFDRYTYRDVLDPFHFDNIARFVDNGGAVLIAAGPEFNGDRSLAAQRNLSFILPAAPSDVARAETFRPRVSELGTRHPVSADLPETETWGRWLRIMPVTQRDGQTLLTGPADAPLLILDRVGEGRVGLLLSDHVWLWARGFDGGGPHAELLRRVAHWLMKEPELEEEALLLRDDEGRLIIERRSIEDAPEPVTLTGPDGESQEVNLRQREAGRFEAILADAEQGLYRAQSGALFAIGAVGLAAPPEFENVVSSRDKLAPLAERSGG